MGISIIAMLGIFSALVALASMGIYVRMRLIARREKVPVHENFGMAKVFVFGAGLLVTVLGLAGAQLSPENGNTYMTVLVVMAFAVLGMALWVMKYVTERRPTSAFQRWNLSIWWKSRKPRPYHFPYEGGASGEES